jgi:hypothetical protein
LERALDVLDTLHDELLNLPAENKDTKKIYEIVEMEEDNV